LASTLLYSGMNAGQGWPAPELEINNEQTQIREPGGSTCF